MHNVKQEETFITKTSGGTQGGNWMKERWSIRIESTQIRWFSWQSGREAGLHEQCGQWQTKEATTTRLESTEIRWFSW
jgi:hypothetical protein